MSAQKKPHWIIPIAKQKCPACHKGDFFIHPHGYRLKDTGTINEICEKCGQRFTLEPGFYFGAAYVSYALNVALMVSCAVAVYVLIEETKPEYYLASIIGMTLLLFPGIFRMSRIIWATMFIPYGGEEKQYKK